MITKELQTRSKTFDVSYSASEVEVLASVKAKLIDILQKAKNSGKDVLFHVSGGSAFTLLCDLPNEIFGSHLTVIVADERFSSEPSLNNSLLLEQKAPDFCQKLRAHGGIFVSLVPEEGESLWAFGLRMDKALSTWQGSHPHGEHIYTVGVGPDGHTLGENPSKDEETFAQLFINTDRNAIGYRGSLTPPDRVTPTVPYVMRNPLQAVVYVTGDKQQAVNSLMEQGLLSECPARMWTQLPLGEVFMYTTVSHLLWATNS